jgi:acyl-CoA synthetase (NDP forming)
VPAHPDGGVVVASRAARSLAELADPPDLAVIAVPAADVLGVAQEAARCRVRALLVVSAGFSDTDHPEGREREEALLRIVRAHGVRLVGPKALGVINTDAAVGLQALIGEVRVRPGGLALSSQSGALGLALLGHATARGLGISTFVALGNRADVSTNDVLEYLEDDERTAVVALYMESFGNPRRFSQLSRRVSRRKPLLTVKGRRGGALGEAASDALFRQAGVLRVETTQALFDTAALLERQPLPGGRRVGVVTNSGGLGVVAADACAARGLLLAAPGEATSERLAAALPGADRLGNPIDLGVRATVDDDLVAVAALLDDEHVDAVLVLHVELGGDDPALRLDALDEATAQAAKPVLACMVGGSGELLRRPERRVPNYRFPEAAVGALALAADRREWLSRPLGQALQVDGIDAQAARALAARAGEGPLGAGDAEALLRTAGIDPQSGAPVRLVVDPDLGPLISVGGVHRLTPLTDVDAEELARDGPAVRDAVVRLAALSDALPELAEVTLDPLSVTLGPALERLRAKTW